MALKATPSTVVEGGDDEDRPKTGNRGQLPGLGEPGTACGTRAATSHDSVGRAEGGGVHQLRDPDLPRRWEDARVVRRGSEALLALRRSTPDQSSSTRV